MSSNVGNNGGIKKMSLEEFLGDDSLGESVWNEDDINLDAISNTTNIDLLKGKSRMAKQETDSHHGFGYPSHGAADRGDGGGLGSQGPPYIVKFSQLPPRFSDGDIQDLFHEKYTKFIKFKLFWELNKNPSIATLKEGSVFDQNFKRTTKVGFVELYSGRDMDKVLRYWTTPLMSIHNIKLEPAQFDDFKEYRLKGQLLKDPRDDAAKPYVEPRRKSNPFGSARPVDTQTKILELEEKVGKLHIEDTKTLRRLSGGGDNVLQPGKVTLLKKPPLEQEKKKPLSYLDVVKKSAEETKKQSASPHSTASPSPLLNRATLTTTELDEAAAAALAQDESENNSGDEESKNLTFKDAETGGDSTGFQRGSHQRSGRGGRGGYSRGHSNGYRGGRGGGGRGGGRGGSRHQSNREFNDNENFQSRKSNRPHNANDSRNSNAQNQGSGGGHQDEKRYSMFKPASGFLHESSGDTSNYKHNYRGGSNNHRGRPNQRGRFTPA